MSFQFKKGYSITEFSSLYKACLTFIFSVLFLFQMYSNDIPVKIDCDENNVCTCGKTGNYQSFDILKVLGVVNEALKEEFVDSTFIACCYHQIAIKFDFYLLDYIESINYNLKAEAIRIKKKDDLLWKTYQNLGINYLNLDQYKKASQYFKKALELPGKKLLRDSIIIYKSIADCNLEFGDIENALNYGKKSLEISTNSESYYKIAALNIFSQILLNSNDSINFNKSIDYSNSALLLSERNTDTSSALVALDNLAHANKLLLDFKKSVSYYTKAINLVKDDTLYTSELLNNLASVYYKQKKHNQAKNDLNKSLELLKKYYVKSLAYDFSALYENLADNYTALQQFDTALLYYQKALINLTNNFRTEDIYQNPNPKDTSLFIYSNLDMIRVLDLKAAAAYQYYQQNDILKYLRLANQCYQIAFEFHDTLQKEISTENSRLFQAKNIVPYIENALKVAYELQKKGRDVSGTAFRFMEKNKATVLLQSINEANALQFANLPDSLLEQEKDLKIAISFYERRLNDATLNEDTITVINDLENRRFENKEIYRSLINSLEENHPEYYRLKYRQNETQLVDVQKQLDDQTVLLSYFVGDTSIYTLLILRDRSQLFKIQKPTDWDNVINNFRETITLSNPDDRFDEYNKKSFKKIATNSYTLYQRLLQKPLEELNHISNLKIIPDAKLNYIPFDLLITKRADTSLVNYKNLPYLLKQKTISYAYSAALMMEQQQTNATEKDYAYGGYAPKYDNSNYSDLPKVSQLVKIMASFFKGKAYMNEEATKYNFLSDSLSYQILHLAMHGKLNDQYPLNSHLVFTKTTAKSGEDDYKLYASDLYLHQVNADLTILNACETGTGELSKGEGVMSLSRAFTYAGCPSLVMSLWRIGEKPSANILESFLKNIKKGNQKDAALRQAKLNYLDNTDASLLHPNYWAGLVLTGSTNAMQFENSFSRFWWALGVSVVLLLLLGGYLSKVKKIS